jgi:hypothetical protein
VEHHFEKWLNNYHQLKFAGSQSTDQSGRDQKSREGDANGRICDSGAGADVEACNKLAAV